MLTCIDVKFVFDSVPLGLSSSANILQIADVALQVVFFFFSVVFFTLETSEVCAIFIFTTKTTPHRSLGALTCKNAAFLTSFPR